MNHFTLHSLRQYFSRDALVAIPQYGLIWFLVAIFLVMASLETQGFVIAFPLFAAVLASQKLADYWHKQRAYSARTIVPHFARTQNRAVSLWHAVLTVFVVLLLAHAGASPLASLGLGLAVVWVSAWVMLRYADRAQPRALAAVGIGAWSMLRNAPSRSFPRLAWTLVVVALYILALVAPQRFRAVLNHEGVWAPLLVIGVASTIAAWLEMRRAWQAEDKKRRPGPQASRRYNELMGWRLGGRLSSLPLPPNGVGLPIFVLLGASRPVRSGSARRRRSLMPARRSCRSSSLRLLPRFCSLRS